MGYSYTILHRKGKENTMADALSRMHEPTEELAAATRKSNSIHEDMDQLKEKGMSGEP